MFPPEGAAATLGDNEDGGKNFLKPTLDALAAGLFRHDSVEPAEIQKYDYDDSGFRSLFVNRLEDARTEENEGVAFCVSVAQE